MILVGLDGPGLEAIRWPRKVLPGVGMVALTLLEDDTCWQAVIATGADDLVPKAELVTDLLPAVWRVAQARR